MEFDGVYFRDELGRWHWELYGDHGLRAVSGALHPDGYATEAKAKRAARAASRRAEFEVFDAARVDLSSALDLAPRKGRHRFRRVNRRGEVVDESGDHKTHDDAARACNAAIGPEGFDGLAG